MPILDYNDKLYLEINDIRIRELPGEIEFKKDVPYIMDLTFSKYDFEKNDEQITGYSLSEINKNLLSYYIYIYIYRMGLSESSLNTIMNSCIFYHIVKYNLTVFAVNIYVEKITTAILISIHMNI